MSARIEALQRRGLLHKRDSTSLQLLRSKEPLSSQALKAEIERQGKRYKDLGFHKKLKMSVGEFKDHVIGLLALQPEEFKGRFNIPVVCFGQISPSDQARLIGINNWLELRDGVSDWINDPLGYKTPNATYLAWMQDGNSNLGMSSEEVREGLLDDERGATLYDGIGLFVAHPQILIEHKIGLPGTGIGFEEDVMLALLYGKVGLHSSRLNMSISSMGAATCGRT